MKMAVNGGMSLRMPWLGLGLGVGVGVGRVPLDETHRRHVVEGRHKGHRAPDLACRVRVRVRAARWVRAARLTLTLTLTCQLSISPDLACGRR